MTVQYDTLVFGGTGDLALNKLFPALYHLYRSQRLPAAIRIMALARQDLSRDEFHALVREHVQKRVAHSDFAKEVCERFIALIDYAMIDVTQPTDFTRLAQRLGPANGTVRVYYLATAPSLFDDIANNLALSGLNKDGARIVLEKPIGHSLKSAVAINESIGAVFDESCIYRIDHYLGKETVQNLMALRFANTLFEPVWRSAYIDNVQITVAETVGVGSRGGYYDHAGAIRDMLQNHLLQLLCLIAMEAPVRFDAESVRNEKLKVLEALRPISDLDVQDKTVRGQYSAGNVRGTDVPAYYFEKNVDTDSTTETFVALCAEISNWRWAGVPFYLRTGKCMSRQRSEIVITFKPVPHMLFNNSQANRLVIRLQPEEGISLQLMAKTPGKGMALENVELDLNLAQAFQQKRRWEAYERLLLDVLEGDSTLFMRRDEVEAAWRWVDPIINGWEQHYRRPKPYPAGTDGPEQANALLENQGRSWLR